MAPWSVAMLTLNLCSPHDVVSCSGVQVVEAGQSSMSPVRMTGRRGRSYLSMNSSTLSSCRGKE
jgi:hypothetical protein